MFLDVIRSSFYTVGNLFNVNTYVRDVWWMTFLLVLIAVAPIIIYGLSNLLFWFFGERKLEKSVVQTSIRHKIKQIVGILLLLAVSFFTLSATGVYYNSTYLDGYIKPIFSPIIYACFVLSFIAFIKYTIGNIVKLIVGAVKRKKHSKKINKDNKKEIAKQTIKQGKPVVNVDSEEVRKVVIPKTREFLHKYRKEGNIKQVVKNHTKEYKELLTKETQQFHNSKEIVEHYINQYSK